MGSKGQKGDLSRFKGGKKEIYPGFRGRKVRFIQVQKGDLSRLKATKNEVYPGSRRRGKNESNIDVLIFVPHPQRHVATDPEAAGFATAISDCRLAA